MRRPVIVTTSLLSVTTAAVVAGAVVVRSTGSNELAECSSISGPSVSASVDTTNFVDIGPENLGLTVSAFGVPLPYSLSRTKLVDDLGVGIIRVPVHWDAETSTVRAGNPQSGLDEAYDATEIVKLARSMGSEILAVVIGKTGDNNLSSEDAAHVVSSLSKEGVRLYAVGNEPGNFPARLTATQTVKFFNERAEAMRSANPYILVGGPTWPWYEEDVLKQFTAQADYDFLIFHQYAMGAVDMPVDDALSQTSLWAQHISAIQGWMAKAGKNDPKRNFVVVGEMNWSWRYDSASPVRGDSFFLQDIVVWVASALGGILSIDGRAVVYADQNGPIGVISQPSVQVGKATKYEVTPIYYGIQAWTGSEAFPGIGAESKSYGVTVNGFDAAEIDVFAVSNRDGGTNIVVVNRSDHGLSVVTSVPQMVGTKWSRYDVTRDGILDGGTAVSCNASVSASVTPRSVTVLVSR